jgi:hypothetical protein
MAGYEANEEQAGGEAGSGLGAQVPQEDPTGSDGARTPQGSGASNGAHAANTEYPDEFVTEYVGDNGGAHHRDSDYSVGGYPFDGSRDAATAVGQYEGFGWLLGPIGSDGSSTPSAPQPIDDFGDEAAMVRPYAWTRGRTKANYDLKLETLISTTELAKDETLLPHLEHRAVSSLCRYPLSVAEVSAKLSIPLGVARVILSDMAELGLISIHRTFADDDIAAHLVLMERVLSGLRRL